MEERSDKLALVTGAARGIGHAIAATLAAAGWRVIAADIDAAAMTEAQAGWTAAGDTISGAVLDVTDRIAVAALMERHAPFDLVVNNAAIAAELLPFAALDRATVERALRINVGGSFIVAQEAARRMTSGAIVNIASRGYLGGVGAAHYVASKAAVVGMTRSMAIELRWRGISVNAVAPGMVETRMIDGFTDEMRERLVDMEPSGAPMDPTIIAGAVAYLASPVGRSMTGQVLLVDGGKTLGVGLY
jgi:3-oxoacyl-[acyl-carrier protein] reductase